MQTFFWIAWQAYKICVSTLCKHRSYHCTISSDNEDTQQRFSMLKLKLPLNCKRLYDKRHVKMEKIIDCSLDTDRPSKLPALYLFLLLRPLRNWETLQNQKCWCIPTKWHFYHPQWKVFPWEIKIFPWEIKTVPWEIKYYRLVVESLFSSNF